jgi:phosphoenolpyruvate carboxykinase (ATP)
VTETGKRNPNHGAEAFGFVELSGISWNDPVSALVERAVRRGEGNLTADGALAVKTGAHTGRSAQVWWDNNKPMEPEVFER